MECWSGGVVDEWMNGFSNTPLAKATPSEQSIPPLLQYTVPKTFS